MFKCLYSMETSVSMSFPDQVLKTEELKYY